MHHDARTARADVRTSATASGLSPSSRAGTPVTACRARAPRTLLALQRAAGNRALQRVLARDAGPLVQRELSAEQLQAWNVQASDATILAPLRAAAGLWEAKRGALRSYEDLLGVLQGGPDVRGALAQLEALGSPAFRSYAAQQLGGKTIRYLTEMASMRVPGVDGVDAQIPGVTRADPRHTYRLETHGEAVISKVLDVVKVTYSNALGLPGWSKVLRGKLIGISASVAFDVRRAKKGKSKRLRGGAARPGPMPIQITGTAIAHQVPLGYWGMDNLDGAVLTARGPSGTFVVGASGTFSTGGEIVLVGHGAQGTLRFENFAGEAKLVYPTSVGAAVKAARTPPKISLTFAAVGAGVLVGWAGEETFESAPVLPQAVDDSAAWHAEITGYGTGEHQSPSVNTERALAALQAQIGQRRAAFDRDRPELERLGENPEFKLDFLVTGHASRRWRGAGADDARRRRHNQDLSLRRAQDVTGVLYELFGPTHTYQAVGAGAVALDYPGDGSRRIIPDEREDEIEAVRRRELAREEFFDNPEQRARRHEEKARLLEADLGRASDPPGAHLVQVDATWRGKRVVWEPAVMSADPGPGAAAGPGPAPAPVGP
jgi:hypothetical protein